MFITAWFTIDKGRNNPTDEWINKMWYTHKMEYHSAIKSNEVGTCYRMGEPWKCYAKWKKPDTKASSWMIPFMWNIQNKHIHRDRK